MDGMPHAGAAADEQGKARYGGGSGSGRESGSARCSAKDMRCGGVGGGGDLDNRGAVVLMMSAGCDASKQCRVGRAELGDDEQRQRRVSLAIVLSHSAFACDGRLVGWGQAGGRDAADTAVDLQVWHGTAQHSRCRSSSCLSDL